MKRLNTNWVGILVTILAVFSLTQLLYSTYTSRQVTECQATVNQSFLDTLKQRAAINDGDRDSIRELVNNLTNATNSADQKIAIEKYNEQSAKLDALRDSFVYPRVEGACT